MFRALPFFLLFFAQSLFAQIYYDVTFPNDTTIAGCSATADTIYPKIIKYGNCSFNVGVSVKDKVFYSGSGTQCSQISRRFRLVYWCDYDPNTTPLTTILNPFSTTQGATAQGTAQNHGHLEYTQVIRVTDNARPRFIDCPSGLQEICDYSPNDPNQYNDNHIDRCEAPVSLSIKSTDVCSGGNLTMRYMLSLDLDGNGSMETLINSSDPFAYAIKDTIIGDTLCSMIDFPPDFELPYGKHKVQWIAKDNCGNQESCVYEFLIRDCLNPTVICKNGISVNIMQTGMITIPESLILEYAFDNCTPDIQLKTGVQLAGTSGVFPQGIHDITFDCNQLGPQLVEVWAQDNVGNSGFCIATVTVQDNMGNCTQTTTRNGQITSIKGSPLDKATVILRQNPIVGTQSFQSSTDANGFFNFTNVPACGMQLAVDFPLASQNVNTLDALTLSQHLMGRQQISDPYQLLSADVDHDQYLTAWDVDALIWKIVKNEANDAWYFLPKDYTLSPNPLQDILPDPMDLMACASNSDSIMLTAAWMGDINDSWSTSLGNKGDDLPSIEMTTENRSFQAGEIVAIELIAPDIDGISGFQAALQYDSDVLQYSTKQAGLVPLKWMYHAANHSTVAFSWHNAVLSSPNASKGMRQMALRLVFTAKQAGTISDVIWLAKDYLSSEAYNTQLQKMDLVLNYTQPMPQRTPTIRTTIFPNPSKGNAQCSVYLPTEDEISLYISDVFGMTRFISSGIYSAGTHQFSLHDLNPGTYFIHVQSKTSKSHTSRLYVE